MRVGIPPLNQTPENRPAAWAKAAERQLGEFEAHELANMVLAFATRGRMDEDETTFAAMRRAAEQRRGDFHVQESADTALIAVFRLPLAESQSEIG